MDWQTVNTAQTVLLKDCEVFMDVYYIVYEWMPNRWMGVWNKRGNCLEFYDKAHAEYFLQEHPEAVHGNKYEIRKRHYDTDDCVEYGKECNVWEGLPDENT